MLTANGDPALAQVVDDEAVTSLPTAIVQFHGIGVYHAVTVVMPRQPQVRDSLLPWGEGFVEMWGKGYKIRSQRPESSLQFGAGRRHGCPAPLKIRPQSPTLDTQNRGIQNESPLLKVLALVSWCPSFPMCKTGLAILTCSTGIN